jgi:hypothetical protein
VEEIQQKNCWCILYWLSQSDHQTQLSRGLISRDADDRMVDVFDAIMGMHYVTFTNYNYFTTKPDDRKNDVRINLKIMFFY